MIINEEGVYNVYNENVHIKTNGSIIINVLGGSVKIRGICKNIELKVINRKKAISNVIIRGKNAKIHIIGIANKGFLYIEAGSMYKGDVMAGLDIKEGVKAEHKAYVFSPGDEEFFYLSSRGLNKEESKKIIEGSFLKICKF